MFVVVVRPPESQLVFLQLVGDEGVELQRGSVARALLVEKLNFQFGFATGVRVEQVHRVA